MRIANLTRYLVALFEYHVSDRGALQCSVIWVIKANDNILISILDPVLDKSLYEASNVTEYITDAGLLEYHQRF